MGIGIKGSYKICRERKEKGKMCDICGSSNDRDPICIDTHRDIGLYEKEVNAKKYSSRFLEQLNSMI